MRVPRSVMAFCAQLELGMFGKNLQMGQVDRSSRLVPSLNEAIFVCLVKVSCCSHFKQGCGDPATTNPRALYASNVARDR